MSNSDQSTNPADVATAAATARYMAFVLSSTHPYGFPLVVPVTLSPATDTSPFNPTTQENEDA